MLFVQIPTIVHVRNWYSIRGIKSNHATLDIVFSHMGFAWLYFLNWGFVFWNVHEVYTVNHLLVPASLVHSVLRAVSYAVCWPTLFAS